MCLVLSAPAFRRPPRKPHSKAFPRTAGTWQYREYGVADGSGIPFNEHRIVDVDKNSFIGKKYGADDREYRRLLRKYNISPANKATLLFMSKENHDLNSLLYSCKFKYANKSYGLKLTEIRCTAKRRVRRRAAGRLVQKNGACASTRYRIPIAAERRLASACAKMRPGLQHQIRPSIQGQDHCFPGILYDGIRGTGYK